MLVKFIYNSDSHKISALHSIFACQIFPSEMAVDMILPKLNHLASPALLRKIDQLREKNVGQHVPLPQVSCQRSSIALSA